MLKSLSQLLKPKSANHNARLISLHHGSNRAVLSSLQRERWMSKLEWGGMELPNMANAEAQNTIKTWDKERLEALDRMGAPLGMVTVENALTTPWPFRVNSAVVGSEASEPVPGGMFTKLELLNATGRDITTRYVEWQRVR